MTLIQFCFYVSTLKQRRTNVISTPCLEGNCLETYQENIHNGVEGCNLSKVAKFIFISLYLMKPPKLSKSFIPPKTPMHSCLSVLVKLYNICGYKIRRGFCFKV